MTEVPSEAEKYAGGSIPYYMLCILYYIPCILYGIPCYGISGQMWKVYRCICPEGILYHIFASCIRCLHLV